MGWHFVPQIPVYLQIVSRIRADILSGHYPADSQIPSVRQLALEAAVNPNTMQRALGELESEGLLYTRGTAGRFVTDDTTVLEKARQTQMREELHRLLEQAKALGLSKAEFLCYIDEKEEWKV